MGTPLSLGFFCFRDQRETELSLTLHRSSVRVVPRQYEKVGAESISTHFPALNMILTFVRPPPFLAKSTYPPCLSSSSAIPLKTFFCIPKSGRPNPSTLCATLSTDRSRLQIFKCGAQAAVDDFIKSGLNICIGGGSKDDVTTLVDAMAAMYQVEALIDVAFISTCDSTTAMLRERDLPSDLLVNFKRGIDLFITPISSMDSACNAVLDSNSLAADKFAAEIANQVVLVILEDDMEKHKSGLCSVPVQVTSFLSHLAVESLCTGPPFDFGVRGATMRSDGSAIADLSLASRTLPHCIDYELKLLPQVVATGFLLASSKTTVVIATRDMQPIDITAPAYSMANTSVEARKTALTGDKREQVLTSFTKGWSVVTEESGEVLFRKFQFTSIRQAQAFVRYVHTVANEARQLPEIKHRDVDVDITVRSEKCSGVTELDALVAKELSTSYERLIFKC